MANVIVVWFFICKRFAQLLIPKKGFLNTTHHYNVPHVIRAHDS